MNNASRIRVTLAVLALLGIASFVVTRSLQSPASAPPPPAAHDAVGTARRAATTPAAPAQGDHTEPAGATHDLAPNAPQRAATAAHHVLRGMLRNAADHAPVATVRARLMSAPPPFTDAPLSTTPGQDQRVLLESTPAAADGSFEFVCASHASGYLDVADPFLRPTGAVLASTHMHAPVVLDVEPAGVIVGRIVTRSALPVALADLTLRRDLSFAELAGSAGSSPRGHAQSAGDGSFRFTGVPPGIPLRLEVKPPAMPATSLGVSANAGTEVAVTVVVEQGYTLRGRVLDQGAAPVPDASVSVRQGEMSLASAQRGDLDMGVRRVHVDADGSFAIAGLAAGRYDLIARAPRHAATRAGPLLLRDQDLTLDAALVLLPGITIAGRVVDDRGEPAAGAEVAILEPRRIMGFDVYAATEPAQAEEVGGALVRAAADGSFESPPLHAGTYDVIADHPDTERASVKDVAAGRSDVVVVLPRLASIEGVVLARDDAEPLLRFQVGVVRRFVLTDPESLLPGPARDVVSADGTFVLRGIRPGTWTLRVLADAHAALEFPDLVLAAGERRQGVVALLPPQARVLGRVVDARTRAPLHGARISTRHGIEALLPDPLTRLCDATTSPDGSFVVERLSAGTVRLGATAPDHAPGVTERLHLAEGETITDVEIRLEPGAVIHGTVFDDEGRPAPGALVQAVVLGAIAPAMCTTDDDGRYELRGLAAGSYTVTKIGGTIATGAPDMLAEMTAGLATRTVELQPGAVLQLDFTPELEGATVFGRVTEAGDPVVEATLVFEPLDILPRPADAGTRPARTRVAVTDSRGDYEVRGLAPGDWDATLQATRTLSETTRQSFDVTIPDAERVRQDFVLEVTGIEGRVFGATPPRPLAGIRVAIDALDEDATAPAAAGAPRKSHVADVFTDGDGAYRVRGLRAGRYQVVAGGTGILGFGGGFQAAAPIAVRVAAGELRRGVDFRLVEGAALTGSVTDARGQPVAGAALFFLSGPGDVDARIGDTLCDALGTYRVDGLEPGTYTIASKAAGYAPSIVGPVIATSGAAKVQDIVLARGGRILVQIAGTIAQPSLRIVDASGLDLSRFVTIAARAPDGTIDLGPVAPGTYTLVASAEGTSTMVQVHHGAEDQVVAVAPGG